MPNIVMRPGGAILRGLIASLSILGRPAPVQADPAWAGLALCQPAIHLHQERRQLHKPTSEAWFTYQGRCGGRKVVIHDVAPSLDERVPSDTFAWAYRAPRQGVHVHLPRRTLVLAGSDRNRVLCVPRAQGDLLVVGSACSGSICAEELTYELVNPRTGKVYPPPGSDKFCDTACANRRLGVEILKF